MDQPSQLTDSSAHDELLKVYFADDPDPNRAGHGLYAAPLLRQLIGSVNSWLMSPAEQMAMIYLLERIRPKVAIEIGTRFGGSLQVLSKYCERVYSLDIDPEVPKRLEGQFPNVEYVIGSSLETLPTLIQKLQAEHAELAFVLVDGDHSVAGVKGDIDAVLKFKPVVPLYIVMHDSFNPECREGIVSSAWLESPHVHAVELDFVSGTVNPAPEFRGQLWGGLSLGVLYPEKRTGRLEIMGRADLTFQKCSERSLASRCAGFLRRVKAGAKRLFGGR